MKRIISMMMIVAMAMFGVACDKSDNGGSDGGNVYGVTGDKYIGTLTTFNNGYTIGETTDYVLYGDGDVSEMDIMMPSAQFVSAMPAIDMAILAIALESQNPDYYYCQDATMVGISDHNPLINDVLQGISNVKVIVSYDGQITVSFDCTVSTETMGDMTAQVQFEGVKESGTTTGFYVGKSDGTVEIPSVAVTYYVGDETLVIDGFSFSNMLQGTTLIISGVELDSNDFISCDNVDVNYTFMGVDATGNITSLLGDLEDDVLTFTISAAMGGSGATSDYNCSYYGEVTVVNDNYYGLFVNDAFLSSEELTYNATEGSVTLNGFKFSTSAFAPSGYCIVSDLTDSDEDEDTITYSGENFYYYVNISDREDSVLATSFDCVISNGMADLELVCTYGDVEYIFTYRGACTSSERQ